jgi:hypothetical protein
LEQRFDVFETLYVTHCRKPLWRELMHLAKIDQMLAQMAKGGARNFIALRGCFVSTKREGQVVESDAAASGQHQVEQVP